MSHYQHCIKRTTRISSRDSFSANLQLSTRNPAQKKKMFQNHFGFVPLALAIIFIGSCSTSKITKRITGVDATRDQFPFFVQLEMHSAGHTGLAVKFCGGTLISDEWILTSAHCVSQSFRVIVHFGFFKVSNSSDEDRQMRTIMQGDIHVHPRFSAEHFDNDIALLKLSHAIPLTDKIHPVEMAECMIAGDDEDVIAVGALKWSTLKTIPWRDCRKIFPVFLFKDSILCAKSMKNNCVCRSDNGGALLDESNDKMLAITNFANHNICKFGLPLTFTLVKSYYKWISSQTGLPMPNC